MKFFPRTKQNYCLPSQLLCRWGVVLYLSPNSYPRIIGMFLNELVLTILYFTEVKRKGERFKDAKQTLLNSTVHVQASPPPPSDVNPHKTMQQFCEHFKFCLMVPVIWTTFIFLWSFIMTDLVWIVSNTWALFTVWLQSISLLEWGLSLKISSSSGTVTKFQQCLLKIIFWQTGDKFF